VASIRKRGKTWYVRSRDETGRQIERKAGPDKSVANQIKRDLESTLSKIKAGILDPRDVSAIEAERVPLVQHVEDYLRFLAAKGCVPDHVKAVRIKLEWLLRKTGVIRLSQLKASLVVEVLAELKASGRSDRTIFHYATVAKSFANWLKKDHRTRFDLLEDLDRPTVVIEADRPALSQEQTAKLIEATATSSPRCGMSGPDRSWLYALAACTGFRRLELQALYPESFNLDGSDPTVTLPRPRTKNRKGAVQPLPGYLVEDLRPWLATKPLGKALFPPIITTALMIRADLKSAGIPPNGFVFHSLRHTFVSGVVASGASVKVCMELARHSKPDLTFRRYSHSQAEDRSKAVNAMEPLWANSLPTSCPQVGVSSGPIGATSESPKPCPDETQVDPSGHIDEPSRLLQFGTIPAGGFRLVDGLSG
jgi:integrase